MEIIRANANDTDIVDNYSNIKSIHIIKDNELIYKYLREGTKDTQLFSVGCIFKSILSVLVGTAFQYKPDPQIIVYLLEEVYGMEITKLFTEKILSLFENNNYQWDRDRIEDLQVSIQFLDEWGQLLLNKGVVGETRLFSEEYYQQCISEYSGGGFPECTAYGLGMWIEKRSDIPYFYASGFGGQYLTVIPQKNMTISILSDMDRPHPENKEIIEKVLQL